MITSFFLGMLTIMINAITYLIPNWLIPDSIETGFLSIIDSVTGWDGILPMSAMMMCLTTILFFHITIWTINGVGSLVSIIRGGGSMKV